MITLKNVEKAYKTGAGMTYVLRRISAEIKAGEFVTIMGPSGAGKTTLLSILGMLEDVWTGEYWFLDHAVHQMDRKRRSELNRKYIGFVFQSYHLLDNLTVYENLDVPLSYRDVPRKQRASLVCDVLDRFQIVGKKDLYPNQLSGGQQQLVGIARAVVGNPKLILADEPTGNLHSSQAKEIMELFKRLNDEGTTIIQVTHSELNASYGNRVIQLFDGWIAGEQKASGEPVGVGSEPPHAR
jgi:putative ABC transport system ATP-binding protein